MYIFYDFETSGSNTDFDQILQIGAILTNERFEAKETLNLMKLGLNNR